MKIDIEKQSLSVPSYTFLTDFDYNETSVSDQKVYEPVLCQRMFRLSKTTKLIERYQDLVNNMPYQLHKYCMKVLRYRFKVRC